MGMATIYKEHVTSTAWAQLVIDMELPYDTDEICIKDINHITETQRQEKRENKK